MATLTNAVPFGNGQMRGIGEVTYRFCMASLTGNRLNRWIGCNTSSSVTAETLRFQATVEIGGWLALVTR